MTRVLRYIFTGRIVDQLADWMLTFAGVWVFLMAVVTVIYIVTRKFGVPLPGAFHFSEQSMIVLIAFPLAAVAIRKGHIQFELVVNRLSPKLQERLELLTHIVGIALFGPIAYQAWILAFDSIRIREYQAGVINFPTYPFRVVLAVGLSIFVLELFVLLVRGLKKSVRSEETVSSEKTTGGGESLYKI